MLNALGLKVLAVTVFAQDSHRKNPVLIKQPAYVFAVVKKHLNPEFLTFFELQFWRLACVVEDDLIDWYVKSQFSYFALDGTRPVLTNG